MTVISPTVWVTTMNLIKMTSDTCSYYHINHILHFYIIRLATNRCMYASITLSASINDINTKVLITITLTHYDFGDIWYVDTT